MRSQSVSDGPDRGRVLGGDVRLQQVGPRLDGEIGTGEAARAGRDALVDLVAVPESAVLVGQQDEPAVGVDAGVASRVLQQHEREQRGRHRLVGHQLVHHPREPHRLPGEVGAQQVGARARRIARREGEVGDLAHHLEPVRQVRRRRDPELVPPVNVSVLG